VLSPIVHHPTLIHLGPIVLSGFGIAVGLGFLIGQIIGQRELTRRGRDPVAVGDAVLASVLGFLIGAKLYYVILMRDWSMLLSRGGFVFWGGLIGGVAAAAIAIRRSGTSFWRVADVAGPGIAAGYAIGRTGCWAVGDDYGKPWNGPLSVMFPEGAPPSTAENMSRDFGVHFPAGTDPSQVVSVYPTQLLEVVLAFVMFAVLWRLRNHKHAEGWLIGVYMVLAGIERFIVEFLRAKDDHVFGMITMAQLIALGMMAAGFLVMWMRWNVSASKPGIRADAPLARAA
jgi:phosphatidylglycerol:prolipoprotein diacylglycerol transferase